MSDDTEQSDVRRPGVRRATSVKTSDTSRRDTPAQQLLTDLRSKSFPHTLSRRKAEHQRDKINQSVEQDVSSTRINSSDHEPGHSEVTSVYGSSSRSAVGNVAGQAAYSSTGTQPTAHTGPVEAADAVLAGEAVVPLPTPTAADVVISAAVDQRHTVSQDNAPDPAAAPDHKNVSFQKADDGDDHAEAGAGMVSHDKVTADDTLSQQQQTSQLAESVTSSHSSKQNSTVVWIVAGVSACTAAAGGVWLWFKRRGAKSVPAAAAAEDDDEFTRALKEMDAEERAFDKQAAADNDAGAELTAEEAALAMQQADAFRREKMIATALADGDMELAKIDAMDSADLENLDPDELAALEAELAELEGDGDG